MGHGGSAFALGSTASAFAPVINLGGGYSSGSGGHYNGIGGGIGGGFGNSLVGLGGGIGGGGIGFLGGGISGGLGGGISGGISGGLGSGLGGGFGGSYGGGLIGGPGGGFGGGVGGVLGGTLGLGSNSASHAALYDTYGDHDLHRMHLNPGDPSGPTHLYTVLGGCETRDTHAIDAITGLSESERREVLLARSRMLHGLGGVVLCRLGMDILAGCTPENIEQVKELWMPAYRSGAETIKAYSAAAAERGAAVANFAQLKESEGAPGLAIASYTTLRGSGVPFSQALTLAATHASATSAAAAVATSQGKRPRDNSDNNESGRDRGKNAGGSKGSEKRN